MFTQHQRIQQRVFHPHPHPHPRHPLQKGKNGSAASNNSTAPIGSKTFLTVTTKVSGGTSKPSDFAINVACKSPSPKSFSGSSPYCYY